MMRPIIAAAALALLAGPALPQTPATPTAPTTTAQRVFGERLPNVKDAVQPGRRIGTLRHKEVGMTVATAFMSEGPSDV